MRLQSVEPLLAALEAGVTLLDTAHAYPGNEALVAEALQRWQGPRPRVQTKGGLHRDGELFVNDARAKTLRAQAEQSARTLGAVDLYLLHAPDPGVELATSVRALHRLVDDGVVKAIGLSNVSLAQLQAALAAGAPIAAVQVALGAFHHAPFRDGLVAFCRKHGIMVQAHTALGGVKRAKGLSRDAALKAIAARHDASAQRTVISWLHDLGIVTLPGARTAATARDVLPFALTGHDRDELDAWAPAAARALRPKPVTLGDGEVVLIMGLPGAGKSTRVAQWLEQGYARLNRDDRGGTLRGLALELDRQLKAGVRRVVLDNTYVTRASRDEVIEIAHRHGVPVRGVWLDTSLEQAQVNVIERGRDDGLMPGSLLRMVRQLEPPRADEGFSALDTVPFVREPLPGRDRPGLVVSLEAVPQVTEWSTPALVIAWQPKQTPALPEGVELGVCNHEGGPPKCWCRPPLPGLAISWAKRHGVDLAKCRWVGESPAFRRMKEAFTKN